MLGVTSALSSIEALAKRLLATDVSKTASGALHLVFHSFAFVSDRFYSNALVLESSGCGRDKGGTYTVVRQLGQSDFNNIFQ